MKLFILYLDILGFGRPLNEEATSLYLAADEVRKQWHDNIFKAFKMLKQKKVITDFRVSMGSIRVTRLKTLIVSPMKIIIE